MDTGGDEITEQHELPQPFHELSQEEQVEDVVDSGLEKIKRHEYVYLICSFIKSTL